MDRVLVNKRYFYDKNRLNYLKVIYKIKMGRLEAGMEFCEEAIRLMSHFHAVDDANILQIKFNELLQNKPSMANTE